MTNNAMPQIDSKPVNVLVGHNVRNFASIRGKSQIELALALGVDASSMSRRIKGITDWAPDEMAKVASLLGVKIWRLFEPLPDMDSNHEPTHSESAPQIAVLAEYAEHRRRKIASHNATHSHRDAIVTKVELPA